MSVSARDQGGHSCPDITTASGEGLETAVASVRDSLISRGGGHEAVRTSTGEVAAYVMVDKVPMSGQDFALSPPGGVAVGLPNTTFGGTGASGEVHLVVEEWFVNEVIVESPPMTLEVVLRISRLFHRLDLAREITNPYVSFFDCIVSVK